MISLNILKKHLKSNKSSQKILSENKKLPLLHFSENAKDILKDGFIYGASLKNIDYSFNDTEDGTDFKRIKESTGYNYAFNTFNFDYLENIMDYEYGMIGGKGMYDSEAILFLSDCIYTQHIDGFNQCVFVGEDADISNAFYLKEIHSSDNPDIEELLDSGEIIWTARTKDNKIIVSEDEGFTLVECVGTCLHYLLKENIIDQNYVNEFNDIYADNNIIMSLPEKTKKITKSKLLRITNNTINYVNDELDLYNDFNKNYKFYIKKINEKLKSENIKTKINGSKIYVGNYIIDLSVDRNPNNFVYENKLKNKRKSKLR